MTLRSYLHIFRERFRLLAFVLVLCVAAAVVITAIIPKTYEADVQVLVTSNTATASAIDQNNAQAATIGQVSTLAALVTTPSVITAVRRDIGETLSESNLRGKISASAPPQQSLVLIAVRDGNAQRAATIANSTAQEFASVMEDYYTPTGAERSSLRLRPTSVATAPSKPSSPNATLNIGIGIVLGLLLGAALAVARDVLDNRVKTVDALGKLAGAPPMGVVVDDPSAEKTPIASRSDERNSRAENFRQLRANLQFADVDHHPRVIAVTSSIPGEGKTMVAMNLASTLAETGFTVCLVDVDLRRPTVAKTLGLTSSVGLTNVLIQQITLSEALQKAGKNFYVLASGPTPPNPSEVLASSYVREVVRSLLEIVDYVVLDTAPLLPVADGAEVAALAEGTLLVARYKITNDAQIKRSTATLARVGARLIGVLLNGVPSKRAGDLEYGYEYYRVAAQGQSSRAGGGQPPLPGDKASESPENFGTDRSKQIEETA